MKRSILIAGLLCGLWLTGFAQTKPKAKYVIDGLFFSEKPAELADKPSVMGVARNDAGQFMILELGVTLSDEARKLSIPREDVPDADFWLKKAKLMEDSYQMGKKSKEAELAGLTLKVDDHIGAFEVKDMQGKTWSNRNTLGRPLVLNFWYTGCGPCIKEMPELSTWVDACPDVNFLAVTWNTADEIRSIIERRGFRFVQITDDKSLWKMFGVQQTPTTVVIDRDGVVRKVVIGTNQQKRDELLECIQSLTIDH